MSSLNSICEQSYLEFGQLAAGWCRAKKFEFKQIAAMSAVRMLLGNTYSVMVRRGLCPSLENMHPEDKIDLWKEANAHCTDPKHRHEFCKATWALGNLL